MYAHANDHVGINCGCGPASLYRLHQQAAEVLTNFGRKLRTATAELKDNAKAVAQGVREGLTRPSC